MLNLLDLIPKKDEYYDKNKKFSKGLSSCDIGLVRTYSLNPIDTFIANKINSITSGLFNHVFIMGKNGDVIEAELSGVKVNQLSKYINNDDGVLVFRNNTLNEEQKKNILAYSYAQINTHYDLFGVISFLFSKEINFNNSNKLFCSELVYNAYSTANVHISYKNEKISPNDIFYYLKNHLSDNEQGWIIQDYKKLNINKIILKGEKL